jgi:hypothetical protein
VVKKYESMMPVEEFDTKAVFSNFSKGDFDFPTLNK